MEKEYAVIFRTKRTLPMSEEYAAYSQKLAELAKTQEGFIRIESVADQNGHGLSVSYWKSLDAIKTWKQNFTHLEAQAKGRSEWYEDYHVEICEVLRSYKKQ